MSLKIQVSRFIVAGTIVNAIDLGVYYLLFHLLSFSVSKAVSFTCASIAGYLFNKFWTFKYDSPSYQEIARYALVSVLALGIDVASNHCILHWYGDVLAALITATGLTSLFTFACFKWWVFRF